MPSPNDHARMIVELLRPGGVDLGRRWLAALLLVPAHERASIVQAVEQRIVQEYGPEVKSTPAVPPDSGSPVQAAQPGPSPMLQGEGTLPKPAPPHVETKPVRQRRQSRGA